MVPSLGGGGAERVIATLARHLDPARCEVILAVGSLENAPYRAEVPDAVRVIDLRARQVRWAAPKLIPLIWLDPAFTSLSSRGPKSAILRTVMVTLFDTS